MKILHLTNGVGWSGGLAQIQRLISELNKHDISSLLVAPPGSEVFAKLSDQECVKIPLRMAQDYDLIAAWKIRSLVRREKPDLVHAHHPIAHAVSLVALSGLAKPPFVVSRRVSFPLRKNPFSWWKYLSRRVSGYAVVSRSVKETLAQGGIDPQKVRVIYSGVYLDEFTRRAEWSQLKAELKIPEDCAVVGKVANYSFWKGQQLFLRAAKRVLAQNPDVIFVLAGKDTLNLAPQAQELGIGKNVRLLGFRDDIPRVISNFDFSVNCAIEGEGLSGAMRESLALEVPVIASQIAGNQELVQEGRTGYLVPVNSAQALADKILYALSHRDEGKRLARAGREWVMANASVEKMAQDHLALYRGLIS